MLDLVDFYNELTHGIKLERFLKEKQLSQVFAPIATFHQDLQD
jgi:hypothetical protein